LIKAPVPESADGLLSVPAMETLPPELTTPAPLATSTPALPSDALLPTRPVSVMLPAPDIDEPESIRTPRDTCATAPVQPLSPMRVIAPVPADMFEPVSKMPAADGPALAPPLVRLPLIAMVPLPVVETDDAVGPLATIWTECVVDAPDPVMVTLPPAALTGLPITLTSVPVRSMFPPPVVTPVVASEMVSDPPLAVRLTL
jgi:hypothetical protein